MEIDELETRYRDQIDLLLNELQTVSLLAVQLEARISQISSSIQDLSRVVEDYIDDQRNPKWRDVRVLWRTACASRPLELYLDRFSQ